MPDDKKPLLDAMKTLKITGVGEEEPFKMPLNGICTLSFFFFKIVFKNSNLCDSLVQFSSIKSDDATKWCW